MNTIAKNDDKKRISTRKVHDKIKRMCHKMAGRCPNIMCKSHETAYLKDICNDITYSNRANKENNTPCSLPSRGISRISPCSNQILISFIHAHLQMMLKFAINFLQIN